MSALDKTLAVAHLRKHFADLIYNAYEEENNGEHNAAIRLRFQANGVDQAIEIIKEMEAKK